MACPQRICKETLDNKDIICSKSYLKLSQELKLYNTFHFNHNPINI